MELKRSMEEISNILMLLLMQLSSQSGHEGYWYVRRSIKIKWF